MTEQKQKMKLPTLDDYLMPNGNVKINKDDTITITAGQKIKVTMANDPKVYIPKSDASLLI